MIWRELKGVLMDASERQLNSEVGITDKIWSDYFPQDTKEAYELNEYVQIFHDKNNDLQFELDRRHHG